MQFELQHWKIWWRRTELCERWHYYCLSTTVTMVVSRLHSSPVVSFIYLLTTLFLVDLVHGGEASYAKVVPDSLTEILRGHHRNKACRRWENFSFCWQGTPDLSCLTSGLTPSVMTFTERHCTLHWISSRQRIEIWLFQGQGSALHLHLGYLSGFMTNLTRVVQE